MCSSLGTRPGDLDIGPADLVQPSGATLRTNVVFPSPRASRSLSSNAKASAAIIHKSLPLEVAIQVEGVSLAILSTKGPEILAARGVIKPEWLQALTGAMK